MDPKLILSLADMAFGIIEQLAPHIAAAFGAGQITPDQQKALMDRIEGLRSGAFAGPEWQPSTQQPPPVA